MNNITDNALADCWTMAMTIDVPKEVWTRIARDLKIPFRYVNADNPRNSLCGTPRSRRMLPVTIILVHFKAARLIVCSSPSRPILGQPESQAPHRLLRRLLKVQNLQLVST